MPDNLARLAELERAQEDFTSSAAPWPDPLRPEAFHGLAGEIVRAIEPHTEADPAALLVQMLVAFGNVVGRGPHFMAEADRHGMNLFAAMVGQTSKGRKGTSWGHVRRLYESVDGKWAQDRVLSGLSSGEGLIWAVRDPIEDEGVSDKRLVALETELATVLKVLSRDGNTLSAIIRQAWDTGNLRTLTKNSPAVSTGAHISIIGHVTANELLRYLDSTEAANGFANRFLWVCVRRSKTLPDGGRIGTVDFAPLLKRLSMVVEWARGAGELQRDDDARAIWHEVYPTLSEGRPGLLGAVLGRAEAQVMRLACIYALLDCSEAVRAQHLRAALAVWDYCEASARFIFGDSLGDPVADDILRALREARGTGMTRTEIRDLFARNQTGERIARALSWLEAANLARSERIETPGRPAERWYAK